jgi:hypothetical protein
MTSQVYLSHLIVMTTDFFFGTRSPDTLVGTMMGYWGSIPGICNRFFSTPQISIQWMQRSLSLRLKRMGREADHLLPSSAEVKMVELYLHSYMA